MGTGASQLRLAIVVVAALLVYRIGNNTVGLWDRDEPRYAQTSKQMVQSGDWVVPRLLDRVRTAKPILIYWCQATAMKRLKSRSISLRTDSTSDTSTESRISAMILLCRRCFSS